MEQKLTFKLQRLLGTSVFPPGTFYEGKKFERTEAEVVAKRGTLLALLTLVGPKDLEAIVFGQAILDSLEDDYFKNLDGPVLPALEKAALNAHRRLSDMALSAHLGQGVDFNLLLAVLWGKVLYLCRLGSGGVYLLRDGKVSEVFLGQEVNVASGSGFVYDGDSLILGSPDFKTHFSVASLSGPLEKLEEKMQALSGRARLAALLLKFQIEEAPTAAEAIRFVRPVVRLSLSRFLAFFISAFAKAKSHRQRSRPEKVSPPPSGRVSLGLRVHRLRLSSRRWRWGLLLLSVALIFLGSVILTIRQSQSLKLERLARETLDQVENGLVAANDLAILNALSAQDELSRVLGSLKRLEDLGVSDPRLSDYKKQAEKLLFQVSKVVKITQPKLLYDFELSQKGISPGVTNLAGNDKSLFLADRKSGAVWRLNFGQASATEDIGDGKISEPSQLSAFGDRLTILTASGLDLIDLKKSLVQSNVLVDVNSRQVSQFVNYNGNLYLLVKEQNQIWRAPATETGYGRPASWFKEPIDLQKVTSLAVNGSIFLKWEAGQILKFEGGRKVDFSLSGFREALSPEAYLYAANGSSDFFLVEPRAIKIYRFSESGAYQKAYDLGGSQVKTIDSLYVSVSTEKLYLLSGSKVYEIEP